MPEPKKRKKMRLCQTEAASNFAAWKTNRKNIGEMKRTIFTKWLLLAAVALSGAACNDDNDFDATRVAGTYTGYTNAGCAYFQDNCTDGETLTIAKTESGLSLDFPSSMGTFAVADLAVAEKDGCYAVEGAGTAAMGMGASSADYPFTVQGTIDASKSEYEFTFTVPAVMGGLTVILRPGSAPAAEQTPTEK